MRRITSWVILSVFVVLIGTVVSCGLVGAQELTRSKAASVIEKSVEFQSLKAKIPLHENGLKSGIEQRLWVEIQSGPNIGKLELSPIAKEFILGIDSTGFVFKSLHVILKNPAKTHVNVTGIADSTIGRGVKDVQFTWEYVDLPRAVKSVVVKGGSGVAYFRLYDDGWRVQNIEYKYFNEPAPLTLKEQVEEKEDVRARSSAERKRQLQERIESLDNSSVEREHLTKLLFESETPTQKIGAFKFNFQDKNVNAMIQLNISDVGFTVLARITKNGTTINAKDAVWFGEIKSFEIHPGLSSGSPSGYLLYYVFYDNQSSTIVARTDAELIEAKNLLSETRERWRNKYKELVEKQIVD